MKPHNDANGIGRSSLRYRGLEQALGERPFVDDMFVPGMLHGRVIRPASAGPGTALATRRPAYQDRRWPCNEDSLASGSSPRRFEATG